VSVCQVALNVGEQTVTAGTASFLIVLVPVFTALLATVTLDERLTAMGWLGLALALGGTAVLLVGQGQGLHVTAGAGPVLIAAIAEAVYFVRQKPYLRRYSGLELATYTLWAATGSMLVFTPGLVRQLRTAPAGYLGRGLPGPGPGGHGLRGLVDRQLPPAGLGRRDALGRHARRDPVGGVAVVG
jgi:drug/metabolite transporter (DMT)-like permease